MASSVFTSLVTEVYPVPGAEGQSVTIRKLAPKHLAEARRVSQARALEDMRRTREALPADMLADMMSRAEASPRAADPLLTHDRVTVLQYGITAWTFPQALTPDNFEDLDDDTADGLARAILRLSKPSLFGAEETARKND